MAGKDYPTRQYPERPVVAVSAAVTAQGRILLVKRGIEPARGQWSLPGGGVELGETVREAVIREVREECGLDILPGAVLAVYDSIMSDNQGAICYHYVIICFRSTCQSGQLKPGSDVAEAHWVSLVEALNYDLTPGAGQVLETLRRASTLTGLTGEDAI